MEILKNITRFLWVPLVGFALWLVYKIFIKNEDKPVTTENSGLSLHDINILSQVNINLKGGENPFVFNPLGLILPILQTTQQYANIKMAEELGLLLAQVENKRLFSTVYYDKYKKTLVNEIANVYGDKTFTLIANNVPNFDEFYN